MEPQALNQYELGQAVARTTPASSDPGSALGQSIAMLRDRTVGKPSAIAGIVSGAESLPIAIA
jgi:hypothetical protein